MKKVLTVLMALCLLLTACACAKPEEVPSADTTAAPVLQEWPKELTSLPAFTEYDTFEYAGQTATGWEISIVCTLDQLEDWRSEVEATGKVKGDFSVFQNGEYVVQISESYATTEEAGLLRVNLYLTRLQEMVWPEEMKDIPAYNGPGAVTSKLAVDTVYIEGWTILEATFYGETPKTFDDYLKTLQEAGFEEMFGEDGSYYLRTRGDMADQVAYEFGENAVVTVTWAICPAADLVADEDY